MADDSPYWDKWEDDLTDAEREARAEDLSWARYRAHMQRMAQDPESKRIVEEAAKRRSEEHVRQLWREAVQRGMSQREPKPKKNNVRRNTWLAVLLLGIPSVTTLIVGISTQDDNEFSYDPGQYATAIGMMACILTIIVAFVVAVASGD